MSKRIYTFEVEIDDVGVHETETYEDGTCDHSPSVSCKDSIARELDDTGRELEKAMTRGPARHNYSHAKKATFIESYSEDEWDEILDRPARKGATA